MTQKLKGGLILLAKRMLIFIIVPEYNSGYPGFLKKCFRSFIQRVEWQKEFHLLLIPGGKTGGL